MLPARTPRRPKAPAVIQFADIGLCYWAMLAFRAPKRGEYFLSGAIPMAYRAMHGMTVEYYIVAPTFRAVPQVAYERGEPAIVPDLPRAPKQGFTP